MNPIPIGPFEAGLSRDLFLICGPCVIESEEHALSMARRVKTAFAGSGLAGVFKASFDKANRTSVTSYRGPGLEDGLRILQ
jgi:2-dehydro-3-deoxyphosphooctonate aldolase (KDO 8-P synthase)